MAQIAVSDESDKHNKKAASLYRSKRNGSSYFS